MSRSWFLPILLLATPAHACINMDDRVPGVQQQHVEFYWLGDVHLDRDSLGAFITSKQVTCAGGSHRSCNDLVIAYLFAKEFTKALDLSTRLAAKFPADYNVVITHAAALELNGKAAEAIPFMKSALALNPKSHMGSEWIHLNILEQRVRQDGAIDPWALIGVDLRPDSLPVAPDSLDVRKLVKQVHYQVNDRRYFTPKTDPLFGALLFVYADLLALNAHRSQARDMYKLAEEYGYTYEKPSAQRATPELQYGTEQAQPILVMATPPSKPESKDRSWLAWAFILAVALGVTGWFWRVASKA